MSERHDFNHEQALIAVTLAHLLELAVNGASDAIWKDRAQATLAEYKASSADEEVEANARLIAAAPDLLDALRDMSDSLATIPLSANAAVVRNALARADAAIAKAEGKS